MTTAAKQVEVKETGLILSSAKVLMILGGRKTQERIVIGNAVAVPVARWIGHRFVSLG